MAGIRSSGKNTDSLVNLKIIAENGMSILRLLRKVTNQITRWN